MKSIKKWSSFLVIFFLVLGFNVSVFAQTFQTSELEGNWYVYSIEVDPSMPAVYWIRGNVNMDESGNLTGTYYAPDGSSVTLSSAQIALDHKGIISGFFTAEGVTATVVHGKMDQSKTFGTSVLLGADSTMDLLSFIKSGGTFKTSDLEGTWYAYQIIIDPSTGAVFWVYGTYDVDASGTLTGSLSAPDGTTVTADSGTLALDSAGIITGNLALSTGQTPVIVHGKMDQGKTRGVVVSTVPDGSMMIGYLNKAGGTFKQTDIAGNWYLYNLIIDPTTPAVFWTYGKASIDAFGNHTSSYIVPTGQSMNLTGTFQMNNEGLSTGTVNFETGDTGIAPSLKLDQSKTSMIGVGVITEGNTVGSMSILQFIKESNIAMPWIPLLLLDEEPSADYWVDSSKGSNTNPGTENKPFKTITKALGLVTAGHKVYVAPGTYDLANGETFPLQLPAGAILIGDEANKGAGNSPTVIKGGSPTGFIGTSIEAGANSVIAGFTILHDDAGATFNENIAITNDGITLRNNHIIDGSDNGIYIFNGADNHTIVGNVIQGNNVNGLAFRDGGVGSLVEDNLITGNGYGVAYDSPGGDLGGGATGSNGGNIISCNTGNDLWTNSGVTIDAQNNFWDHVPPTVSDVGTAGIDIRRDLSSTVITTGAVLAPSPCL